MVMQPVEHTLRVELGMFRIANMEDMRPRNEDILEKSHTVEFIALGGQRVFDWIMLHHALTTNDRHPFGIDRSCRENNLLAGNAGPEKYADMDPVGKRDASADRF